MKLLIKLYFICITTATFAQQYTAPTIEWQQVYGGTGSDEARSIKPTKDSGYILAGNTTSIDGNLTGINDSLYRYAWILKLDNTGKIEWQKAFRDNADAIYQTVSNDYIFFGRIPVLDSPFAQYRKDSAIIIKRMPCTFEKFGIVKLSSTGNVEQQNVLEEMPSFRSSCVSRTKDGGYIAETKINWSNLDSVGNVVYKKYRTVVKFNSSGNVEWRKEIADTSRNQLCSIEATNDGGYIVSEISYARKLLSKAFSYTIYSSLITKLNGNGTVQWQKKLEQGGDYFVREVLPISDGYIVVGNFHPQTEWVKGKKYYRPKKETSTDFWIAKLDLQSEVIWQKTYGGEKDESAFCATPTKDGNFVIAGYTTSFRTEENMKDEERKRKNNSKYFSPNCYIIKINGKGDLLWQKTIGGEGADMAQSIQQTLDGGYVLAGTTNSFDAPRIKYHFNDDDNDDLWIVKLSPDIMK